MFFLEQFSVVCFLIMILSIVKLQGKAGKIAGKSAGNLAVKANKKG